MKPDHSLKYLLVTILCCFLAFSATARPSFAQNTATSVPRALWVWDATAISNVAQGKKLLDFCTARRINTIFIDLGDFDSDRKQPDADPKHVTAQQLGDFVERFHAARIKVEGLNGDPSFALREKHQSALDRMQRVLDYNATASEQRRLDGYQWDVEPYVLDAFKGDEHDSILEQYLEFVQSAVARVKKTPHAAQFDLGFAVPFWFDKDVQAVTWQGQKQPVVFSVMDILSTLPKSYIAIMAYRDRATGTNSIVEVSRTEMDYAAKLKTVGVWVGVETGKVEPASITFHGKTNADLEKAIDETNTSFCADPGYRGVAIHHWKSYDELVNK